MRWINPRLMIEEIIEKSILSSRGKKQDIKSKNDKLKTKNYFNYSKFNSIWSALFISFIISADREVIFSPSSVFSIVKIESA
jgi:hypothetical protein